MIQRYWSRALTIPLCQGIRWEPTWKALPSDKSSTKDRPRGIFLNLKKDTDWFFELNTFEVVLSDALRIGIPLWSPFIRYPCDPRNREISVQSMADTRVMIEERPHAGLPLGILSGDVPGRLAQSTESGAGKRRVFAIGNYVNQRSEELV